MHFEEWKYAFTRMERGVGGFMTKRLDEKVVVITGAAQGIGRGCAQMAAREGARVVIGDIQQEAGEATAAAIRAADGKAVFHETNVVNETECAALMQVAYAADNIRVNYLIPGWVLSEGELALQHSRGVSDADLQRAGQSLRLGRHQTPEDAAYAVVYLASDESAQVTGTILNVDAGAATLPFQPGGRFVG